MSSRLTKLRYMRQLQVDIDKRFSNLQVLLKTRAAVLYEPVQLKATAQSFRSDKPRTASVLNDFKNEQSYGLIDEEILRINEVSAEKTQVEI